MDNMYINVCGVSMILLSGVVYIAICVNKCSCFCLRKNKKEYLQPIL